MNKVHKLMFTAAFMLVTVSIISCLSYNGISGEPQNSPSLASSSSADLRSSSSVASSSSADLRSSSSVASSSSADLSSSSSVASSSSADLHSSSSVETYESVSIEIWKKKMVWMKKNLNINVAGSVCYNNDPANCEKYGRLYNWTTAMALPSSCDTISCNSQIKAKHKGICPSGWHLPSCEEWDELISYAGSFPSAGKHLKATNGWVNGWMSDDAYGFTALPGGSGYPSFKYYHAGDPDKNWETADAGFSSIGMNGLWWSASEIGAISACNRMMASLYDGVSESPGGAGKTSLLSVRCVQD